MRTTRLDDPIAEIAQFADQLGLRVAVAESLTSGLIASRLGAGKNAASWFCGCVVAYQESVKHDILGVREGPVITAECARVMASGVARLLGAQAAVATSGVGGPGDQEGKPPGTVYLAADVRGSVTERELSLDGDPEDIIDAAADASLHLLADALRAVS